MTLRTIALYFSFLLVLLFLSPHFHPLQSTLFIKPLEALPSTSRKCLILSSLVSCERLYNQIGICGDQIDAKIKTIEELDSSQENEWEWNGGSRRRWLSNDESVKGHLQELNDMLMAYRKNDAIYQSKCAEGESEQPSESLHKQKIASKKSRHPDRIEQVAEKLMKRILKKHKKDMLDIERVHSIIDLFSQIVRRVKRRLMSKLHHVVLYALVALAMFIYIGPLRILLVVGTWMLISWNFNVSFSTFAVALACMVFLTGILRKAVQ
mmetsp:Transcript_5704/g.21555  ORF Transcript_5704/g.21555 Transcript_5704/m.21555 type:complete len:266 (+) Transcript_5704:2-799(+)